MTTKEEEEDAELFGGVSKGRGQKGKSLFDDDEEEEEDKESEGKGEEVDGRVRNGAAHLGESLKDHGETSAILVNNKVIVGTYVHNNF